MKTNKEVYLKIKENLPVLSSKFGVKKIGIFGSMAKGNEKETSDIDLIVEFSRPIGFEFYKLNGYLENLLGRKVDILTSAGLNNIRINKIADDIRKNIVYV